jgi:ABC-2 type transport system permease protein
MTAHVPSAGAATGPGPFLQRLYGLRSVFGKTVRDSRRATVLVGGLMGLVLIAVTKAIVSEFSTPESRVQLGELIRSVPPILQGLAGKPVAVETLGGYVQYKYGTFFPLVASLWSILALSGTLAAEARRGSLEFVAAAAVPRRRIAVEKLFGHVSMLAIAMLVVFGSIALAGSAFPVLPGDEIGVVAAAGYATWLFLLALVSGALAFAIAPFLGRGAAVGFAGAVTFAGFILNGYQAAIPQLAPLANLTWFGWTTNHIPLAGRYDWPAVVLVAVVAAVLLVIGVEAFVRRDIGVTSAVPTPSLPRALLGLRGPGGRAWGENLPAALAWGIGLGLFALVIAGSGTSFLDQLAKSPDFLRLLASVFPGIDFATVGGFLQLLFVEFGLVLIGLAAANLVARWASDETSGRVEFLLAAPVRRARWVISGGVAVFAALALIILFTMVGIVVGALITGGDVISPLLGTLVLGLYAIALAGIGFAIAGVFGAGVAGPAVVIIVIGTWFVDLLGPLLQLPDAVQQLALTAHYGQPMVGVWDGPGIVASVLLAVGGVAIGAWGFARRDLRS